MSYNNSGCKYPSNRPFQPLVEITKDSLVALPVSYSPSSGSAAVLEDTVVERTNLIQILISGDSPLWQQLSKLMQCDPACKITQISTLRHPWAGASFLCWPRGVASTVRHICATLPNDQSMQEVAVASLCWCKKLYRPPRVDVGPPGTVRMCWPSSSSGLKECVRPLDIYLWDAWWTNSLGGDELGWLPPSIMILLHFLDRGVISVLAMDA